MTGRPGPGPPAAGDEGPMIRRAHPSDIAAVLDLWREAEAEPTHTDDAASLGRLIDHDPGALLVADEGGRIVGTVVAAWDGWRGSVYRLVVATSHRRTGLGRRLVAAAGRRLSEMGAVRLQAIVVETNAPALGFWQASGWVQQAERLRFVDG
jgi:ribosomal protein S18 acetylase RimI-like enzyme